jgi:hypothetical protein
MREPLARSARRLPASSGIRSVHQTRDRSRRPLIGSPSRPAAEDSRALAVYRSARDVVEQEPRDGL